MMASGAVVRGVPVGGGLAGGVLSQVKRTAGPSTPLRSAQDDPSLEGAVGTAARGGQSAARTVVVTSADRALRSRLRELLSALRWVVYEAEGGADALARLEELKPEALLVDAWLPDLEAGEFAGQVREMYPAVEVMGVDGAVEGQARSPRRNELLHALREAQGPAGSGGKNDTAVWNAAPVTVPAAGWRVLDETAAGSGAAMSETAEGRESARESAPAIELLPGMVGASAAM